MDCGHQQVKKVSLVTLAAKWVAPSFLLKGPRFILCLQVCAVIKILDIPHSTQT